MKEITEEVKEKILKLWRTIASFEKHEEKNDSTNPLLSKARRDARMKAYVTLMETELGKFL